MSDSIELSLRDWFAGMALQGQLANELLVKAVLRGSKGDMAKPFVIMANDAYRTADAMLKARIQPTQQEEKR